MGDYELQELEHTTGLDGHNDGDHNTSNNELSSIDEAIESAKEIIKQQTTLEPLAIKIQGKSVVGKTFTNILIYVCKLFRKAIKDEAIRLVGSAHKQKVLKDLNGNSRMLTELKIGLILNIQLHSKNRNTNSFIIFHFPYYWTEPTK